MRRTPLPESGFRATLFQLPHKRRKGLCVKPERMDIFHTDDAGPIYFCVYICKPSKSNL